jgi:hypothetical protein
MLKIIEHIKDSACEIAIFAAVFAVLGYFIPQAYYQYFDKTQYFSIENPMMVEGNNFYACDTITVEVHRKAAYAMQAVSVSELVLYKDNVEVARYKKDLSINLDSDIVHTTWDLPCNLMPGNYFFRGVVNYKFRGLDKTTEFFTTVFDVISKPKEDE